MLQNSEFVTYNQLNINKDQKFRYKKVAIDISIFLYKFKYNNKNIYEHF